MPISQTKSPAPACFSCPLGSNQVSTPLPLEAAYASLITWTDELSKRNFSRQCAYAMCMGTGENSPFLLPRAEIVAHVAEGVYAHHPSLGKEVSCTLRGPVPFCRGLLDASQPLAKVDPHIA